jgi:RNA polymerase sigma-70 factor (ECF subfamily)
MGSNVNRSASASRPRAIGAQESEKTYSFEDFFREHYEGVVRFMFLMTGNASDAEDLAETAFLRLYERWGRVSNAKSYVYTTATNLRRSALRRMLLSAKHTAADSAEVLDAIQASEDRELIRQALSRLSTPLRAAFVLVEGLGLTSEEAAILLNTSPGAVRVRMSRARHALREHLGGRDG